MEFYHYFLPFEKRVMRTGLPLHEIQNRFNWFLATPQRGGPFNGYFLKGRIEGNTLFFESPPVNYRRGMNEYAIVANEGYITFHARWKRSYRNGYAIFFGLVAFALLIMPFADPVRAREWPEIVGGTAIIFTLFIIFTKAQSGAMATYTRGLFNATEM